YMVHGINTDTSGIGPWVSAAGEFKRAVSSAGVTSSTAFVAWFRYDSGGIWTVSSDKLASSGASKLGSDLEGLAAVNPGAERILSGYPYGTTLVGQTMTPHAEYVGGVHLNGSAGLTPAARCVIEAGLASDAYFVTATEASKDSIAWGGRSVLSNHR